MRTGAEVEVPECFSDTLLDFLCAQVPVTFAVELGRLGKKGRE
jgi:hypothetical protein